MKKALLVFIAVVAASQIRAQNINDEGDYVKASDDVIIHRDVMTLLSRWFVDVNATGGMLNQNISSVDPLTHYFNAVNSNISDLKFTRGRSYGIDAQAGYFFGDQRHFGVSTGFMYMAQQGTVTMNNFHIEYESRDVFNNAFRQVLTANGPVSEKLHTSNFSIPLLLKYNNRFSRNFGFTAEAGLLYNLMVQTKYNANANFNYEAVYDYVGSGSDLVAVYDGNQKPGGADLLITEHRYLATHTDGKVQQYFNQEAALGYNVGLGVKPNNNTGTVSYINGSLGFLVRPAVSFYLSDQMSINLGAYYLFQNFHHNAPSDYQLTNKVGDYGSLVSGVSQSTNNAYGVSLGLRFFLGEPTVVEHVVTAEDEAQAPEPAPEENSTMAPESAGNNEPLASNKPADEEPADQPEKPEIIDISTPILFDLNSSELRDDAYPIIDEAIKQLNADKNAYLVIHGYTDNTGSLTYDNALSKKRAAAVKSYMTKKGVKPKWLKVMSHGPKDPVSGNATEEDRARNRRVVIKLEDQE